MSNKRYSPEFKDEAVRRVTESRVMILIRFPPVRVLPRCYGRFQKDSGLRIATMRLAFLKKCKVKQNDVKLLAKWPISRRN